MNVTARTYSVTASSCAIGLHLRGTLSLAKRLFTGTLMEDNTLVAGKLLTPRDFFYKRLMSSKSKSCNNTCLPLYAQNIGSSYNFAHYMTAQLSGHLHICDSCGTLFSKLWHNEFELWAHRLFVKCVPENRHSWYKLSWCDVIQVVYLMSDIFSWQQASGQNQHNAYGCLNEGSLFYWHKLNQHLIQGMDM